MIDEIPEDDEVKIINEFEQFMDSFWLAAFDTKLNLNGCTHGSEEAWEVISKIIDTPLTDPIEILKTIEFIATHVSAFTHALDSCSESAGAIYEGVKQLTWFEDAEGAIYYFQKALGSHPFGFMLNVKKAQSAFSDGRYADAGKLLGTDLHWMIDEIPEDDEVKIINEFEQFMDSFWLAAFDTKLNLDGCTQGSEEAWEVISLVVKTDFSDPMEIIGSISYLAEHLSAFTLAFNSCSESAQGVYEGIKQLTWFEDAEGAIYYFERALGSHPFGFMLNVKKAQSAFSDGRYADAGKFLGTDLHWMIDEIPEDPEMF
jgi:uncharacterized protein GlcG (DUF336 family)